MLSPVASTVNSAVLFTSVVTDSGCLIISSFVFIVRTAESDSRWYGNRTVEADRQRLVCKRRVDKRKNHGAKPESDQDRDGEKGADLFESFHKNLRSFTENKI